MNTNTILAIEPFVYGGAIVLLFFVFIFLSIENHECNTLKDIQLLYDNLTTDQKDYIIDKC